MGPITIIGIGSPVLGDEVGMAAVALLQSQMPLADNHGPLRWLVRERPGMSLMDDWEGAEQVVLLDALVGAEGDVVQRIEPQMLLHQARGLSSHELGVAEVLAMADTLGRLPPRLLIYGIDIRHSEETNSWLPLLAEMLREDLVCKVSS